MEELNFPENSFDAVIMIDAIEHLPEQIGYEMFRKAEKWAKKKIIISTPNDFIKQLCVDGNIFQQHLSGWDYNRMIKLCYECRGLAGLKILRTKEYSKDIVGDDLTTNISFRPKLFWFIITTLSQIYTYRHSRVAYGLFCVKLLNNEE